MKLIEMLRVGKTPKGDNNKFCETCGAHVLPNLKPCPLCFHTVKLMFGNIVCKYFIECNNDLCVFRNTDYIEDPVELIEKWNKREGERMNLIEAVTKT